MHRQELSTLLLENGRIIDSGSKARRLSGRDEILWGLRYHPNKPLPDAINDSNNNYPFCHPEPAFDKLDLLVEPVFVVVVHGYSPLFVIHRLFSYFDQVY